jgi:hypothetical protein
MTSAKTTCVDFYLGIGSSSRVLIILQPKCKIVFSHGSTAGQCLTPKKGWRRPSSLGTDSMGYTSCCSGSILFWSTTVLAFMKYGESKESIGHLQCWAQGFRMKGLCTPLGLRKLTCLLSDVRTWTFKWLHQITAARWMQLLCKEVCHWTWWNTTSTRVYFDLQY